LANQYQDKLYRANWIKRAIKAPLFYKPISQLVVPIVKALPGVDWKGKIPVVADNAEIKLPNGSCIWMGRADKCDIARELYWRDGKFDSDADKIAFEAACKLSVGADYFFDIGAYTGLFSLGVAKSVPDIQVHAYEIFPENFFILFQNVLLNGLNQQIYPHLNGIADVPSTLTMPLTTTLTRLPSSFAMDWTFSEGIDIPVNSLDSLHKNLAGKVVMKIDVETFETEVLQGASDILSKCKTDIICEVLKRATKVAELNSLLDSHGLQKYLILPEGLSIRKVLAPEKAGRDWLFSKRPIDELKSLGIPIIL